MDMKIEKTAVEAISRTLIKPAKKEYTEDKHANEYYTTHLSKFKKFNRSGQTSINVLEFLHGKQWDDIALAYVHALQPSSIRVTHGTTKADSRQWRVTVYIDDDNNIKEITQEVVVGLPEEVAHGEALGVALRYGINSPQNQWYNGEYDCLVMTPNGYFKSTEDGLVEFPKPDEE